LAAKRAAASRGAKPAGEHAEELENVDRLAAGAAAHPEVLPPGAYRLEEEMVRIEPPGPRRELAAVAEPVVGNEADRENEQDHDGYDDPQQRVDPVRCRGTLQAPGFLHAIIASTVA
jgi:hypothetical protein